VVAARFFLFVWRTKHCSLIGDVCVSGEGISLTDLVRRVNRLERRDDERGAEISELRATVSGLKAWRDNERVRHSNTPAWLFGTIAAVVSVGALVAQLWIASLQ
jgi:hypothetical protein